MGSCFNGPLDYIFLPQADTVAPAADFDMFLTFKFSMTLIAWFLPDGRCDFMKVVPAGSCDTGMSSLYFVFLFQPVVAELNLPLRIN